MTGFKRTMAAVLAAAILLIAGCSGGPGGNSDDPVGVVNAALAAAESGGFAKLSDYSCAANKDDLANVFGGNGDVSALASAGVNLDEVFSAMKIDFQDMTATESSKTDTDATVHLKGKVAITFDAAKMREVVKKILAAQGVEATDQMVDAAMQALSGQMSQTQDVDNDLKLTKENGKWVVCS